MAASANPNDGRDDAEGEFKPRTGTSGELPDAATSQILPGEPVADWLAGAEGRSPSLTLEGFSGPLDHLLTLARTQKIDLAAISLSALIAQLTKALQQAPASVPLGQKAHWVVMAAWLVQLRTRLLLSADTPTQQEAAREAGELRDRLVVLDAAQALALWLERRPQLGRDAFARGNPEVFRVAVEPEQAVDVIEFLWASLALFDDPAQLDTVAHYQPRPFEFYALAEARERIRQRLAAASDGAPLDRLLPDAPKPAEEAARANLRRRSAWSSTFVAGLELAKQGEVVMEQGEAFGHIHIALTGDRSAS